MRISSVSNVLAIGLALTACGAADQGSTSAPGQSATGLQNTRGHAKASELAFAISGSTITIADRALEFHSPIGTWKEAFGAPRDAAPGITGKPNIINSWDSIGVQVSVDYFDPQLVKSVSLVFNETAEQRKYVSAGVIPRPTEFPGSALLEDVLVDESTSKVDFELLMGQSSRLNCHRDAGHLSMVFICQSNSDESPPRINVVFSSDFPDKRFLIERVEVTTGGHGN